MAQGNATWKRRSQMATLPLALPVTSQSPLAGSHAKHVSRPCMHRSVSAACFTEEEGALHGRELLLHLARMPSPGGWLSWQISSIMLQSAPGTSTCSVEHSQLPCSPALGS